MKQEWKDKAGVYYTLLYGSGTRAAVMWEFFRWNMTESSFTLLIMNIIFQRSEPYDGASDGILRSLHFFSKAVLVHPSGDRIPAGCDPLPRLADRSDSGISERYRFQRK